MCHFAPTFTKSSALDAAKLFVENVFKLHGIPVEGIVCDRDKRWNSKFYKEVMRLIGTKLNLSTSFHPQSDGQTERMNRVLEDVLRHYVNPVQNDWDEYLAAAEYAVNSAVSESTKASPFSLNYSHQVDGPIDVILPSKVPAAEQFTNNMRQTIANIRTNLLAAQERQKYWADKKRRALSFDVGDMVMISTTNIKLKGLKGPGHKKFLPKFIGPFPITKIIGKVAYRVQLPVNVTVHNVFHVSLLKKHKPGEREQPPPPEISADGELLHEVERILIHRDRRYGKRIRKEYLVKWEGYPPEHNSWEPEPYVKDCEQFTAYWHEVNKTREETRPGIVPT
jgi:hypothetical protein